MICKKGDAVQLSAALTMSARAIHVIDDCLSAAVGVASDRAAALALARADHRFLDAVLTLAATGSGPGAHGHLELTHRLTLTEFDSLLIDAVGSTLFNISRKIKHHG